MKPSPPSITVSVLALAKAATIALATVLLLAAALEIGTAASGGASPAAVILQVRANETHDVVDGKAPAHTNVTLRAWREGAEIGAATLNTGKEERFSTSLTDGEGRQVDLKAGDEVHVTAGTQTAIFRLAALAAEVDAPANRITGHVDGVAYPAKLRVEVWRENGSSADIKTDGSGNFELAFGEPAVREGDNVAVWYVQADGHESGIVRSHLRLEAGVKDDQVAGQTTPGARIDVVLHRPGGLPQVQATATAWANAEGQFGARFQSGDGTGIALAPGDEVEAQAGGKHASLVLPSPYSAVYDYKAATVCGEAPPGVILEVELWGYGTLFETAPADGHYCTDLAKLGAPDIDAEGRVSFHDANGHRLIAGFRTPSPDLKVENWGAEAPVTGRTYAWVLRYANTGEAPAANTVLIDTLPQGVSFVRETTGTALTVGNRVIWDLGAVPPGAAVTVTLTVQVNLPADKTIENCVEVSTPDWERDTGNNRACDQRQVVANQVDLSVKMYAIPEKPVAGDPYVYRIGYCNTLPASAQSAVINATLPAHTRYAGEWHPQGWALASASEGQVRWTMPEIPGHECRELEIGVEVDANAPAAEPLHSSVSLTSTTFEVNTDDNDSDHEVWVTERHVNLHIEKGYRRGSPVAGQEYTFWITLRNDANSAAPHMIMTDTLPAGMAFVQARRLDWNPATGANDLASPLAPLDQGPGFASFSLGDLVPWRWIGVELTGKIADAAAPGSTLTNTVRVTSTFTDDRTDDNEAAFTFTTQAPGSNLRVVKRLEGDVCPGCGFDYDLWLVNDGTAPDDNVTVRDRPPASVEIKGVDGWGKVRVEGGALVWDMGTINPGDQGEARLYVRLQDDVPIGAEVVNRLEIQTTSTESRQDDNASEVRTLVGPDLRVVQNLCPGERLAPGWDPQYCIELANAGAATAHNVVLTATLPSTLGYRDDSWGGEVQDNQVIWHFGDLPAGWQGQFQLHVQVAAGAVPGETLTTILDAGGAEADAVPADNHSELPLRIESPYWLQVQESQNWVKGRARPDESLTVALAFGISLKRAIDVTADAKGYFNANMCDKQGCTDIQPGDSVSLVSGGSVVTSLVVNRIEGQVDVDANTFNGHVYGAAYPARVSADLLDIQGVPSVEGATDVSGDYHLLFAGADLGPGHRVQLWTIRPDGHWVGIVRQVLRLEITARPNHSINLGTPPDAIVHLRVATATGVLKLSSEQTASADGRAGFDLDALHPPVALAAGDVVSATTGAATVTLTIPDLLPLVDDPADQVFCLASVPPSSSMTVGLWRASSGESWWKEYTAGAGRTVVDFSQETISLGDKVALVYRHPEGHEIASYNISMILAVSPMTINDTDVATTLTLAGQGFKGTPEVYLAPSGGAPTIHLQGVTSLTGQLLQATMPAGTPGGAYDLYLYNRDGWIGFLDKAVQVNEYKLFMPLAQRSTGD